MAHRFRYLAHALILAAFSSSVADRNCWAASYSTEESLASDFSDYVPYDDDEDAYEDEAFLYFGKDFGVSLGSGLDAWTGVMSKYFKPAMPTFDFRMLAFSDRLATEFGASSATYRGSIPEYGTSTLRLLTVFVDWKYYLRGDSKHLRTTSTVNALSPNPFVSLGLTYFDLDFEFRTHDQAYYARFSQWTAPIVGKLPFPIIPTVAAGLDFALKPRSSSLVIEGRWIPLGSLLDIGTGGQAQPVLDEIFQERRLGDTLSAKASLLFAF